MENKSEPILTVGNYKDAKKYVINLISEKRIWSLHNLDSEKIVIGSIISRKRLFRGKPFTVGHVLISFIKI